MTIKHHKSIKINVVMPSHVRALATKSLRMEEILG